MEWTRADGVATGGGVIAMTDAVLSAAHTWSEGSEPDGETSTQSSIRRCQGGICVHNDCPSDFTIVESPFSPNRQRCLDAAMTLPLQTVQRAAFTLAHEAGHSKYDLTDEYFLDDTNEILYGFRVCSNSEWNTSLMGERNADLWCDQNTHLHTRFVNSPFLGITPVSYPPVVANGDQWSIAKRQWMNLMSYDAGPAFTQGPGVVPQNEIFRDPIAPWQPLGATPCACSRVINSRPRSSTTSWWWSISLEA